MGILKSHLSRGGFFCLGVAEAEPFVFEVEAIFALALLVGGFF